MPSSAVIKAGPEHSALVSVFIQLLGVGTFALIAGINDELGKIVVIIMAGIMLAWAFAHANILGNLVGRL